MTGLHISQPTGLLAQVGIRRMRHEDLEQVQLIDRISFSLPWPESAYKYELEHQAASLPWVADLLIKNAPTRVLGCIVVWVILDEAHIATLAVHPDFRRLGISRLLLVAGLKDAYQRGCRSATLEVRAGNLPAQALYRHFGFIEAGVRTRYYKDNQEDALIMTLHHLDDAYLQWLDSVDWRAAPQSDSPNQENLSDQCLEEIGEEP